MMAANIIRAAVKQALPPFLIRLARKTLQLFRSTSQLTWLEALAPRLYLKVQQRRYRRAVNWLRLNTPQIYERLDTAGLDASVRLRVLEKLANEPYTTIYKNWSKHRSSQERISTQLLYVARSGYPDMVKEIIALRRVNPQLHCTLLTTSLGKHTTRLCEDYFDRIFLFRYVTELIRYLKDATADVVIIRGGGGSRDLIIPTSLFWDGRLIYRPSGFLTMASQEHEWGGWSGSATFAAEKFLMERADGIFHFYTADAMDRLRVDGMEISAPFETIYPSCVRELGPHNVLPKLSSDDGELHLVHATGIGLRGTDPRLSGYGQLWDKWRTIVDQRIHIHVYMSHVDLENPGLTDYHRLAADSAYFHIEPQAQFDELLTTLTQFDYALQHWDLRKYAARDDFKDALSNSFWTYMQAGLPIITSSETPGPRRMVEKYGIGLVVPEDDISHLRKILDGYDPPLLQARVLAERDSNFQMDHRALWNLVMGA